MKTLVLVLGCFMLTVTDGWATAFVSPVNGHTYFLTGSRMLYWDAEAEAVQAGGHLATIRNAGEQQWIYETFAPLLAGDAPYSIRSAWIGLYQDHSRPDYSEPAGGWGWVSGEPLTYTDWHAGEPNEGGDYHPNDIGCMVIVDYRGWDWGGEWNDADDFYSQWCGIIELVPEPSSVLALLCGLGGFVWLRRR